jgi:N-dimethylarginine dimethylaminohydrolase
MLGSAAGERPRALKTQSPRCSVTPMQVLMCPPTYYGIEYEINPWMSRSQQSNRPQAQLQWETLRRLLEAQLGIDVSFVDSQPGLPDMVFTANAGLVWKNKFISSNFRHEVRRGESAHFDAWFRAAGFEILHLPEKYHFEGEGDLLKCGQLWFAGYHIRSDINAHQRVADIIEQEILSLELADQWFYHLDTCFCPLSERQAFFYPPAFDPYALKVLENNIPQLVPVSAEEANRFACNAIVAGNSVAMNDGCPKIREQLESLGFQVFETPLSEFLKAGGSAKCLILIIREL